MSEAGIGEATLRVFKRTSMFGQKIGLTIARPIKTWSRKYSTGDEMAKNSAVGQELADALRALNIGDPHSIKRVVIDIDMAKAGLPEIYVEHYSGTEVIDVVKALSSVTVTVKEKE